MTPPPHMTGHHAEGPAEWLRSRRHLLPSGAALDVACGRGRNALWLAEQGFRVRAVDRDADAIAATTTAARARRLTIDAAVVDLEGDDPALGHEEYDLVVVFNYLHRPFFPALHAALRPGGVLVYETFTRDQARRGKPTNPAFLLEPGELLRLVAPLTILDAREEDDGIRSVASVVARKEATPFDPD